MPYAINPSQPTISTGLGTFTRTLPVAGPYTLTVMSSFVPASSLVITVTQNGSNVSPTPTGTLASSTGVLAFELFLECAADDVINVILSDSNAADQSIHTIKTIINLYPSA